MRFDQGTKHTQGTPINTTSEARTSASWWSHAAGGKTPLTLIGSFR